ncbi:hypothetical protein IKF02_00410 [Candidatus Saccharibacteria bacterium]|nr:hypothetical protein [Candidatus Saccharibacteria bacterium]
MKNEKEHNKELFIVEAVIGIAATILVIFVIAMAALLIEKQPWMSAGLIVVSVVAYIIICLGLTKMEQIVGYYECANCHYKNSPKYGTVLWSMHFGRTRYLPCSKCHKWSWQKKVL